MANINITMLIVDILSHVGIFAIILYFYSVIIREKFNKKQKSAEELNAWLIPLTPRAVLAASNVQQNGYRD